MLHFYPSRLVILPNDHFFRNGYPLGLLLFLCLSICLLDFVFSVVDFFNGDVMHCSLDLIDVVDMLMDCVSIHRHLGLLRLCLIDIILGTFLILDFSMFFLSLRINGGLTLA